MSISEMTPERWRQVQWLFDAVLSREPAERPAFLEQATADDHELRREVDSLIASLQAASRFIEDPAFDIRASTESETLAVGARVGAYRVERLLGSGGVGRVYLASRADQAFEKQVAIKVLKRGMDTDELVRRFVSERQILAQLEHPNIAQLLDGGATEDGRPYLVMESVDGVSIDRWCAEQTLGVRQRLKLFLAVCDAVQFAHRNLVIHRDLKPGNILVNRAGEPKLLDFGIAKLLSPQSFPETVLPTQPGWRAMTPEYASPEQVRGEAVTTGADVYALGVVLYELLTGRRPYEIADTTPVAIETAVCRTEPRRASKVAGQAMADPANKVYGETEAHRIERQLTGDLDSILQMALEKAPDRRYATVEQLATDIERHLGGLPVSARKDTALYRAAKFIRRHRLGVATAATVLGLLFAFLATLLLKNAQITRQRDRAELVSTLLTDLFEISEPSRQRGDVVTARSLLDKGARDIEARLRQQPGLLGELLGTIGATYSKLGLYDEARPLLERSMTLTRESFRPDDPAVADASQRLADLHFALDDYNTAESLTRETLRLRRQRLGETHIATLESLFRLARIRHIQGEMAEADGLFAQAGQLASDEGLDELLIEIQFHRGLLARYSDRASAEDRLREALTRAEAFWGSDHPQVALILAQLGEVEKKNDAERAEALLARAVEILRKVYREPHPDLASTLNNQAVLAMERGRLDEAESGFREALSIQRATHAGESALEAIVLNNLASITRDRGEFERATQQFRESLAMHERVFGAGHTVTANVLNNLNFVLQKTGHLDEAEGLLRETLGTLVETLGEQHTLVAIAYNNLGQVAQKRGDPATAQQLFEQAASLFRALAPRDPALPGILQNLANLADRGGDGEQAKALYLEAFDILAAIGLDDGPQAATLFNNLAVSEIFADNPAAAEPWARRAIAIYEHLQEPGSLDRLRARRLLAAALEGQERYADAEAVMQQNLAVCQERWGAAAGECDRHTEMLERLYGKWTPPTD
ncbi:MAG: serine/threonine-protein kinase [Acidobacteriota bacterium]